MWSASKRQVFNNSKLAWDTLIRVLRAKLSFLLFKKTRAHLTSSVISRCLSTNRLMVKTKVCPRPLAQQSMSALDSKSKHPQKNNERVLNFLPKHEVWQASPRKTCTYFEAHRTHRVTL